MGLCQAATGVEHELHGPSNRQRLRPIQNTAQVFASQKLHDQVGRTLVELAAIDDANDVLIAQACNGFCLPAEALGGWTTAAEPGAQYLHGKRRTQSYM